MIEIRGSAQRRFCFPASPARTLEFYRDAERAIGFLRHITIAARLGPDRFRLAYSATEAAVYRVRILCEVRTVTDEARRSIVVAPVASEAPGACVRGLSSITGHGRYASLMQLRAERDQTRVEFTLSLEARLPVAYSLRLVPRARVAAAAERIMHGRIDEIVDGFVAASIGAYLQRC